MLTGDFNAEEEEDIISEFMELYDLKNLVKEKTCFKLDENPLCVLFLTNCPFKIPWSYQLVMTVLKTTFKKGKPKEIVYRSHKNYDKNVVSTELSDKLY